MASDNSPPNSDDPVRDNAAQPASQTADPQAAGAAPAKAPKAKGKPPTEAHLKRVEANRRREEEAARKEALIEKIKVLPPARPAKPKRRHWGILISYLIIVMLPLSVLWWYLSQRAADQFVSHVGFSVRTEEASSAMELLGGLSSISRSTSSDPDILYEFIQSQELVARIDERMDLRAIYSKPENDPFFTFPEDGTIEDLVAFWERMVKIFYDGSAGLIELRVLAFDPDDAQGIATAIFEESSAKINELSAIARSDATRYAREELEIAIERLKNARRAITDFRNTHQLVDPQTDIQGQVGLLNTLQQQLADSLIELDLLAVTTSADDPRVVQANRKIEVIRARIDDERRKFGRVGALSGEAYSVLLGDFEELTVDREFAEQAYLSALSGFDQSQAEASRQSRYLAAYISPTKAERSTYPRRQTIMGLSTIFLLLGWATAVLLAYAIRDRR